MSNNTRRYRVTLVGLFAILVSSAAALAASPLLSEQRWRENSYGLSLRPPVASRMLTANMTDAAVCRIAGEGNYFIEASIKTRESAEAIAMKWNRDDRDLSGRRDASQAVRSYFLTDDELRSGKRQQYSITEVGDIAVKQFAAARPDAFLLKPGMIEVNTLEQKRPTVLLYFKVPDAKRGPWIVGQSLTQIDAETIAMLKLEVPEANFANARPIFEAVLNSLKVESPAELRKQREELIANGEKWRATIDARKLQAGVVPEQWYRIREGKTELGHMRIVQSIDTQMNTRGVRIEMQAHYEANSQSFDTLANYFLSEDGEHEAWSIKTTTRAPKNSGAVGVGAMGLTVTETGARDGKSIAVHRVTPKGEEDFNWDKPALAMLGEDNKPLPDKLPRPLPFLSQVEVQMLDTLLPHKTPLKIGFYWYFPQASKIVLRTERVVPQKDGSCLVYSRLSPEQEEQVSQFDARGKLVKRTLPSGQVLLPTTREELAAKAAGVAPK